jgi:hypothetical protein
MTSFSTEEIAMLKSDPSYFGKIIQKKLDKMNQKSDMVRKQMIELQRIRDEHVADEPESDKIYRLTGTSEQASILRGDSWKDSIVRLNEDK